MRYRQYIIPICFFVICWLAAQRLGAWQRASISDLVNMAGANGEPILVVVNYASSFLLPYTLQSLDTESIPLQSGKVLSYGGIFFDVDGALYSTGYTQYPVPCPVSCLRLPDYCARRHEPPNLGHLTWQSMQTPTPWWVSPGRWYVQPTGSDLEITDLITGERLRLVLGDGPPFEKDHGIIRANYTHALSPSGDVVVVTADNPGMTDPDVLWRYEVETGEWTRIGEIEVSDSMQVVAGPGGNVVAVYVDAQQSPQQTTYQVPVAMQLDVVFIDGRTGEELARVPNASSAIVGNKWAACRMGGMYGNGSIVLFDMENDWERQDLQCQASFFAIYEPPPEGLDGMLDNYDWGHSE